jgi:NAD(P)H dehydrogenase (quinone)
LITRYPLWDERLIWFMGEKRVGWIANDDIAAVSAKVLAEGPAKHAGQNYWLSTEAKNGVEAAEVLTQALGREIACTVQTPADLMALLTSGSIALPAASTTEANYGASTLEWMIQTFDGRMDYSAVATTDVQDLLGRPPIGLREWAEVHRDAVLAANMSLPTA